MSVENHRHCQATVLGATGDPYGEGLTWNTLLRNENEFSNLGSDWLRYFRSNNNITERWILDWTRP